MNWIWIGVIISLILIELVSLNFTSIWFVISAIVSFILLKLGFNYIVQVSSFLIVGFILIIVLRPIIIDKLIVKRNKIIQVLLKKYSFISNFIPNDILKDLKKESNNINQNKKKKKKRNK